jgi:hypothetical protein
LYIFCLGRRLLGLRRRTRLVALRKGRKGRPPECRKEYARTQESRRRFEEILDLEQRPGHILPLDGEDQYLFGDSIKETTDETELVDARCRPLLVGARSHLPARSDRRDLALVEPTPETGEAMFGEPKALLVKAPFEGLGREGRGGHAAPVGGIEGAGSVAGDQ